MTRSEQLDIHGSCDRRAVVLGLGSALATTSTWAVAASRARLDESASAALHRLYGESARARELRDRSRAVLIFPSIVKGGFVVGAQTGDGVLRIRGNSEGYYNITAASFGFQAGAQRFSLAMFFITEAALQFLENTQGWSIGSGPNVTVLDKSVGSTTASTKMNGDVIVVPFGQKGLMGGLGIEGSKISPIKPS